MTVLMVVEKFIQSKIAHLEYELQQHCSVDEYKVTPLNVDIRYYEILGELKALKDILSGHYQKSTEDES